LENTYSTGKGIGCYATTDCTLQVWKKYSWAEYVWYKIAELENLLFNLFAIFKAEVCGYEEHPRTFSWEMLMYKEVILCCTWLHDYIRDWARLTLLTWTLKKDTN